MKTKEELEIRLSELKKETQRIESKLKRISIPNRLLLLTEEEIQEAQENSRLTMIELLEKLFPGIQ